MTSEADESKICHPSPRAIRLETQEAEFQFMCKGHLLADLPFAGRVSLLFCQAFSCLAELPSTLQRVVCFIKVHRLTC